VPLEFRGRQPKISEPAWNAPSCMVNGDYEYGPPAATALCAPTAVEMTSNVVRV